MNRELKFDSPSLVSSITKETRTGPRSRSPNYQHVESQITRDVKYDPEPVLDTTPNSATTCAYNYSKTSSSTRKVLPCNTEIVEMDTGDLPAELKDVPISKDLLPGPGTKVTTTVNSPLYLIIFTILLNYFFFLIQIKTYTYEIPNDTQVPTNRNFTFKNEYYNSANSSNTHYPDGDVPPPLPPQTTTTVYSNESNASNRTENIFPPKPDTLGPNQTYYYKKEVNETKNNVYGRPRSPPPPVNTTSSLYERNITDTRNVYHPPGGIPVYPNANLPPHQPGTKQTYLYKKETTNTTNTVYEPPTEKEYPPPSRFVESPPPPEPTTNKYYKYSSQTTTTKKHGRPEQEPLLAPFPTGDLDQPTQVDSPPKNLGQLLASFDEVGNRYRISNDNEQF